MPAAPARVAKRGHRARASDSVAWSWWPVRIPSRQGPSSSAYRASSMSRASLPVALVVWNPLGSATVMLTA